MNDDRVPATSPTHGNVSPKALFVTHNVVTVGFAGVARIHGFTWRNGVTRFEKFVYHISVRGTGTGELKVHADEVAQPGRSIDVYLRLHIFIFSIAR